MNNSEPVSLTGAVTLLLQTGVTLAALLLPGLKDNQALQIAIIAFGNAAILVAGIAYSRSRVTSVASPTLPQGTNVTVLTPEGAPNKVTTL